MSIIFENLKKKFEVSNCNHKECKTFSHDINLSGSNLAAHGILTRHLTKCGILILLFRKDNQLCMLYTKRSLKLKSFPGEICFPGGKFDPLLDNSLEETAERETFEEIGLMNKNYSKLTQLCPYATVNGHYIQVIVAMIHHEIGSEDAKNNDPFENTFSIVKGLKPNDEEVDSIVWCSVNYFSSFIQKTIPNDVFNFVKIPINENDKSAVDRLRNLVEFTIPDFYMQFFFTVNELHLVYGFNSFFTLLVIFMSQETDSDLEFFIDSVNFVNRKNIMEFIENMNKLSYVSFILRMNREILAKNNKSKL